MLRISFPAKSKTSLPVATQIEVDSTPLSLLGLASSVLIAAVVLVFIVAAGLDASQSKIDRSFWYRLADTKKDDQAHVMAKVFSGDAAKADVVILGTSSAREAVLTDTQFNAELTRQNSPRRSAINLATGAQSPIESLLIADAMPPHEGQLFVLFISLYSFKQALPFDAIEKGRLMRPPEDLIKKYSRQKIFPPHWLGFGDRLLYRARAERQALYRHLNYRLKYGIAEQVYAQPAPIYSPHLNVGKPPLDPGLKRRQIEHFNADLKRYLKPNLVYVANTLGVLADFLKAHKCRFVIATPPELNNEMRELFPLELGIFNEMLQTVRSAHPFELLELNDSINWEAADFHDLTHVNESGRSKWSRALATWLSQQPPAKSP
jgi:hypothetical protein